MPPIRKNGYGKQLPQPKTHTTPADRQAMTTHRAERYANFPRKAQQTGRSAPPDTMSYRSSAGNQVHPLNSSLVFFILPHAPQKSNPVLSPRPYQLSGGQRRRTAQFPKCGRRCNYLLPQCLRFETNLIRGFPCVCFSAAAADGLFVFAAGISENQLKS